MTVQERRERNLKRRRRQAAKRNMIILLATVLLITIGSVIFGTTFSSAKDDVEYEMYYKSIEIEKGDSLWSIAEEYKTEDVDFKLTASQISRTAGGNPFSKICDLIYSKISLCFELILPCAIRMTSKIPLFSCILTY